ncbi:hypothetical protein MKK67_06770 [Methylobacterium sp. J-072]|uniref:DUF6894 family protein n=1 Tax=Methylobacterium sp. J-072 TaxID=2836651 RepID=UPI001FBB6CF6|nr:hypothetical protein [Methylobacterium sp. J-072]MCJ2092199.1 hypothetical protein [Methylobacterium sp. J-072]
MSERFYFDIENGEEILRDEEGVEASSFEEVMEEARSVIQEMAVEVTGDNPGEMWTLVVRASDGSLVGRLPIKN